MGSEMCIRDSHYPAFCGIHIPPNISPPATSRITILHLLAATTDGPPEAFPGQQYKVDKDRRYDDVSSCRRAYEQKEYGDNGCLGLRLRFEEVISRAVVWSLIHATRTCMETSAPAPSHRTRFALSVTQRRSRRSSCAWYAFSRSTGPFP